MPSKQMILGGAGLVLLLAAAAASAPPPPASTEPVVPVTLSRARVDAARKTYAVLASDYRLGWLPWSEPVYRWSRRWLDAERDLASRDEERLAAVKAHLQRMRDLDRITQARFRRQDTTVDESTAAQYFRLEAEVWLYQAAHH